MLAERKLPRHSPHFPGFLNELCLRERGEPVGMLAAGCFWRCACQQVTIFAGAKVPTRSPAGDLPDRSTRICSQTREGDDALIEHPFLKSNFGAAHRLCWQAKIKPLKHFPPKSNERRSTIATSCFVNLPSVMYPYRLVLSNPRSQPCIATREF